MLIVGVLIKVNVNRSLPLLFLDLHVVPRGECVDVYYRSMGKDLVVNQRGEFLTCSILLSLTSPPSLNLMWHLAAASRIPASPGFTLLRS